LAGRLAVDFGTCNTRLALWDPAQEAAGSLWLPGVSAIEVCRDADGAEVEVPYIPSFIHFDGKVTRIGREVQDHGLTQSQATFWWMKRYISNRLELPRPVGERTITYSQAGAAFLGRVLDYAGAEVDLAEEEIAFTAPVEAYEHYQKWLAEVCDARQIRRYRLLDEASAAALGYGVGIQAGDVYMVFDFGGGTLDVSIVRVEHEAAGGRGCRSLGKGAVDLGGSVIDDWIYQDVLQHTGKSPEDVRHVAGLLLMEAERVKRQLSDEEAATLTVVDPDTGAAFTKQYTRSAFEDLLEQNGLYSAVQSAIDMALAEAREAGYERDHIKAVLMVGGSSRIPSVRRAVRQTFGERVYYHMPLNVVALGAAAFVAGADFYDHIQHEYALRYYDRSEDDFAYKTLVKAGTPYPSAEPVAKLTIKASHDEQAALGINIYEVARPQTRRQQHGPGRELVWDASGCPRLQECENIEEATHFWMNEHAPTFIRAEPKAKKGDPRFPVQFTIDGNKRLCVTVRDNLTGKTLMRDQPVIKLT